ncbi:hypothetical protein O7543_18200 [Solwaraspora sp. WMMA2080]|uniref:hypothetical protein n=1 Tax=unclassified Solwaraspora TaxID=2627926 RepID=UPI00248B77BC|nr:MULTISPECIES: hypothetical protein [unclassified Solwaraspora]WBB97273.1 hypothetical protein O7553_29170 [Solwaraspora sp. WMMA2059]WBC18827.1 hypothetical protein O7543_18200 [Solwaraspora sp. WMMA2080]
MWKNIYDGVSLLVSLVGFGLTIWQLRRTANAAEATQRAVERTETRMALNHLLVLLPQFRVLETELDFAVQDEDRKMAMKVLASYAQIASQVAGLIDGRDGIDKDLMGKLERASRDASLTKARIINEPTRTVRLITKDFRSTTADLAAFIGSLASRFSLESGR